MTRTLADYRPQHDDDCNQHWNSFAASIHQKPDVCSCGLSALLASASQETAKEEIRRAPATEPSTVADQRDGDRAGVVDGVLYCFGGCGTKYSDFPCDTLLPTPLWNRIAIGPPFDTELAGIEREGRGGVLCPTCIIQRLIALPECTSVFVDIEDTREELARLRRQEQWTFDVATGRKSLLGQRSDGNQLTDAERAVSTVGAPAQKRTPSICPDLTPEAIQTLLKEIDAWLRRYQSGDDCALLAANMGGLLPDLVEALRHLSTLHSTREAEAFKVGLETQRVYAGEGGWEWFHQPSGRISKTPEAALAAYRLSQGAVAGNTQDGSR